MAKKATGRPRGVAIDRTSTGTVRYIGTRQQLDQIDDFEVEEEARLTAQAEAEYAVAHLSPSSFATFTQIADAIPEHVRKRVLAGQQLCLIARLPDQSWMAPTHASLDALVQRHFPVPGRSIHVEVHGIERGYGRREQTFNVNDIVKSLLRCHVLVPVLPGETVGHVLPRLADVELCLYPTVESLSAAVRRKFHDATWPKHIATSSVQASAFDLALKRASSSDHAFELIEALAGAHVESERERKAAEKAEASKSPSSSSRSTRSTEILRPTSPRLDDLHGYGAAAVWGRDLVRDLHDYRDGKLTWSDVDAGCLLYGPPGTGKTLFASALAASAGVPFVATSYADWQSQGDGSSGYVVKCLRQRFADANENAPCILFIDEIDTVVARGSTTRHDDWWAMINTALLEALDGTTRREGLVVVAACNHPDRLDPALVRSGRLDRRFEIGLPDESALARIFAHHLPGGSLDAFEQAATVLAGTCSGADVARIAREARRAARRERRDLVADDLLAIAMPADKRSSEARRLVAVHEAGHAVALLTGGRVPDALSVVGGPRHEGAVRRECDLGLGYVEDVEREIVVLLAGRAAEEVVLGRPSAGASYDLENATSLLKRSIGIAGLGGRLTYAEHVDGHVVEERLRELYGRALRLVGQHRPAVEALADLALERRVLPRKALAQFANTHGFEVRP